VTLAPTFLEWLLTGRLAPYVNEYRLAGSAPLSIVHVRYPAGDLSDSPTSDLVLALIRSAPIKASRDPGIGRFRCLATPGDRCLSTRSYKSSLMADDPQDMLILAIPDKVCRSHLEGLTDRAIDFAPLHASPFTDHLLMSIMTTLWAEAECDDEISRLFVDSATSLIVTRLWRLSGARESDMSRQTGLAPWARKRVVDYLRARLTDPVTLKELAAEVRLSPSHFCTAFRHSFGLPPHRWWLLQRIEKAKELLSAPGPVSMSEVALECGFATSAHFAAAFRRHAGMTPSAWRREAAS